jgi:hypothetical protein
VHIMPASLSERELREMIQASTVPRAAAPSGSDP